MKLAKPVKTLTSVVFVLASLVAGCQPRIDVSSSSRLRDLSYDPNAKNIALLFGAANGLPGITDDLNHMKQVLEDPQGGNGFQVIMVNDATRDQILNATKEAAVAAGENGTIVWYFTGHGASSGELMTTGGMLPFAEVSDAIRSVRQTPVKRMFAFFDSCFSGQMVDGSATVKRLTSKNFSDGISDQVMKDAAENYADAAAGSFFDQSPIVKMGPSAYEQLIVMSASQRYETSLAGSEGSEFTNALSNVFRAMKSSKPNATIGDFLEGVKTETTRSTGGSHTPAYRVMPEQAVMGDTLFAKPRQQNLQNNPGVPQAALKMIVAIGPSDATSNAARLYIGTDASIAKVGLCSGRKDACLRNPQVFLDFRLAQAQNVIAEIPTGGVVYESAKPIVIEGSKPVTFLGFDANGRVVATRTIQFRRN